MEKQDKEFLLHIVNEIARYANENEMSVDETIDTVAEWLAAMRKIATFENLKGVWDETEEADKI